MKRKEEGRRKNEEVKTSMKIRRMGMVALAILLAGPVTGLAVTGAWVETNGWLLRVDASPLCTNLSWGGFGLGISNNLSRTQAVVLTLNRLGYDDAGNVITNAKILYGTCKVRWPYPDTTRYDNASGKPDTSNALAIARIALNDYVYSNDWNLVLNVAEGVFSNAWWLAEGGAITGGPMMPNLATNGMAITNLSTLASPAPVANWTWPGFQQVTGSVMTLRAVGFGCGARLGRPLRAMQFVATDQHGHTATNIQTRMKIDRRLPDPIPAAEYVGEVDVSSLTQGDLLRCDFTAWPWDGTNALSTADALYNLPYYCPQTNLCDRLGTYGTTIAVVDWANGVAAGVASTNALNAAAPPVAFSNIALAASAIVATNSIVYGRANASCGIIYLTNGAHWWIGGTAPTLATQATWITITRYPGVDIENVVISNNVGNRKLGDYVKLDEVTIVGTNSQFMVSIGNLWWNRCRVDITATLAPVATTTNWFVTHCGVTNLGQGFKPSSTQITSLPLVRGNYSMSNASTFAHVVMANWADCKAKCASSWYVNEIGSGLGPLPDGVIVYNNFVTWSNATDLFKLGISSNVVRGAAVVQNVFETRADTTGSAFNMGADQNTSHMSNVMVWNNSVVGERSNLAYNDADTVPYWKVLWSVKGNLMDDYNLKTDVFVDGTFGASGNRIGNWACLFGVGFAGNAWIGTTNVGAPSSFNNVYELGFDGVATDACGAERPLGYEGYVLRAAHTGSAVGTGGGNYRLKSSSPLFRVRTEWLLPYDIEGVARGDSDPPGAYSTANPARTRGMMGQ